MRDYKSIRRESPPEPWYATVAVAVAFTALATILVTAPTWAEWIDAIQWGCR